MIHLYQSNNLDDLFLQLAKIIKTKKNNIFNKINIITNPFSYEFFLDELLKHSQVIANINFLNFSLLLKNQALSRKKQVTASNFFDAILDLVLNDPQGKYQFLSFSKTNYFIDLFYLCNDLSIIFYKIFLSENVNEFLAKEDNLSKFYEKSVNIVLAKIKPLASKIKNEYFIFDFGIDNQDQFNFIKNLEATLVHIFYLAKTDDLLLAKKKDFCEKKIKFCDDFYLENQIDSSFLKKSLIKKVYNYYYYLKLVNLNKVELINLDKKDCPKDLLGKFLINKQNDIKINVLGSKLREVEVLHDFILDCYTQNSNLKPKDFLILMPSAKEYLSFIESVFSPINKPFIPINISYQTYLYEDLIGASFLKLLQIKNLKIEDFLWLLRVKEIGLAFDINFADLEKIEKIFLKNNIYYLFEKELINTKNTLDFGLKRLLLSYAMPINSLHLDVFSLQSLNDSEQTLLAKILNFYQLLKTHLDIQKNEEDGAFFSNYFFTIIDDFYHQAPRQLTTFISSFDNFFQKHASNKFSCDFFYPFLKKQQIKKKHRLNLGKINFIDINDFDETYDFKIICVLGLNDSSYPIYEKPIRLGDVVIKTKNQNFLIDANLLNLIFSFQTKFYLSYSDKTKEKNDDYPSLALDSLNEFLEPIFKKKIEIKKHSKFIFSTDNFIKPKTFAALWMPKNNNKNIKNYFFSTKNIKEQDKLDINKQVLVLDDLAQFCKESASFFARKNLQLYYNNFVNEQKNLENIEINPLEKYQLQNSLVNDLLKKNNSLKQSYKKLSKSDFFSNAQIGQLSLKDTVKDCFFLLKKTKELCKNKKKETLNFITEEKNYIFQSSISNMYGSTKIEYSSSKYKIHKTLKVWLEHLVLNSHSKYETIYVFKDQVCQFLELEKEQAKEYLEHFLNFYFQKREKTISFSFELACSFVKKFYKKNNFQNDDLVRKNALVSLKKEFRQKVDFYANSKFSYYSPYMAILKNADPFVVYEDYAFFLCSGLFDNINLTKL